LLICILVIGTWSWRKFVLTKRSEQSMTIIQTSLENEDFVTAKSALLGISDPVVRAEKEKNVRVAELEKAISISDLSLIRMDIGDKLAETLDPKLLESADIKLARDVLQKKEFKAYETYKLKWQDKSAYAGQWLILDVDALFAKKLPEEARSLLKSAKLSGVDDAQRYVRLALLDAKEPWKAMESLDLGLKSDPRNADILAFRAQIQEAAGRLADARLDYVAAVLSERKNPLYRDILANFYLRVGDISAAAETWREAAEDTNLGVYAMKSWFWSTVSGNRLSKPLVPCRQEDWSDLVTAILQVPDAVFWSASLDAAISEIRGVVNRPEFLWMKLLESLRSKDYAGARKRLEIDFSKEAEEIRPGLALRILSHLDAIDGKDPRSSHAGKVIPVIEKEAHPFLLQYAKWVNRTLNADENARYEKWLAQPEALISMFFSVNWAGAAVILGEGDKLAVTDAPDWFGYSYAKSLQLRDGKDPAKKWLESLAKRSPAADLLLGEILLTSGSTDEGLSILQKISADDTELSSRAAWTLALLELDRGQPEKAREVLMKVPSLANATQGKEILARIFLAEGARAETLRIYQELGESSADGMIFMSKEAFSVGDYDQALKWTGVLARLFPDQPDFRKNILKIEEARNLKKP
jgi:hypothetical protein